MPLAVNFKLNGFNFQVDFEVAGPGRTGPGPARGIMMTALAAEIILVPCVASWPHHRDRLGHMPYTKVTVRVSLRLAGRASLLSASVRSAWSRYRHWHAGVTRLSRNKGPGRRPHDDTGIGRASGRSVGSGAAAPRPCHGELANRRDRRTFRPTRRDPAAS